MKLLPLIAAIVIFSACHIGAPTRPSLTIALQPIGKIDSLELTMVESIIKETYGCKVVRYPEAPMPELALNEAKGERYNAATLLKWLHPGNNSIVLGITHKDIYTYNAQRQDSVWGILGLGTCPGNTCIISDHRFIGKDIELFVHRLDVLVLHEIGHNLGLPHCMTPKCIMNDAEGKIATLDNAQLEYCEECRHRLAKAPWSW